MKQKLGCVLLIDDNEADNFMHQLVIEEADCTEKLLTIDSAREALGYLDDQNAERYKRPDLIFLDINMPGMNGWEFLEAYEKLDENKKSRIIVVLLTTSLLSADKERASSIKSINEFQNKPLTEEKIKGLLRRYFE